MHFLGHLLAAQQNPYQEIGQIAGDFVRMRDRDGLAQEIKEGYKRHVAIDAFTDRHPAILASKVILTGPYRRYAGLTLDLYYDHLIAKHFSEFSSENFDGVVAAINQRLVDHEEHWPSEMKRFTHYILESNLLFDLKDEAILVPGMKRITYRLKRDIDIERLVDQVLHEEEQLFPPFLEFMADFQDRFWPEV